MGADGNEELFVKSTCDISRLSLFVSIILEYHCLFLKAIFVFLSHLHCRLLKAILEYPPFWEKPRYPLCCLFCIPLSISDDIFIMVYGCDWFKGKSSPETRAIFP